MINVQIEDLIRDSLARIEHERELVEKKQQQIIFNAVCVYCGQVIAVESTHELYEKCYDRYFKNHYLDALPYSCYDCKHPDYMEI